ncbi:MAG: flagellar motor switch protein FliN [Candidimonas sp.]|nr:MAG: flagellar motor switch protein FliN [Candidimonas sp.]
MATKAPRGKNKQDTPRAPVESNTPDAPPASDDGIADEQRPAAGNAADAANATHARGAQPVVMQADTPESSSPAVDAPADMGGDTLAGTAAAYGGEPVRDAPPPAEAAQPAWAPTATQPAPEAAVLPRQALFQPLGGGGPEKTFDVDLIQDIPVEITVELGHCRITIRELLQLGQGSILELENEAGAPMNVYVNGFLMARGEVVVVNDHYGIRLTEVVTAADRLAHLSIGNR